MWWFFIALYWLVGIVTSASVYILVLISQTGNVGVKEDANFIVSWGLVVIVLCTCFSSFFACKCKGVEVKNIWALIILIFLNPICGLVTLYLAFKYGF